MTGAWGSLHVGVWKDEILITLPGTNYTVTYYKPANSLGLLAKNFPTKDDSRVPMTQAECGSRPPHHIALPCDIPIDVVVTERGLVRPFGSPEQKSRLVV